ncbi:DUF2059 domain-containing protein [Aliiruegeria lutimaris]|uniref:Uncharacterized protein n=1 Tax=Aliiruegeria lutimaris TaxID=571298 RepID=A0A1G8RYC9_9RHOB|nr:DUF2059 domain-containing protein [Aliiruegeria lutimaris]SDJ21420.1 hypothetical protein SAMN04488026_10143 [Aliiruegeria lutimaris]
MTARLLLAPFMILLAVVFGVPVGAGDKVQATEAQRAEIAPLIESLHLQELFEIVQLEGLSHAADLEKDMFPGRGKERWPELVRKIYDPERMTGMLTDAMAADMPENMVEGAKDFFDSDLGQRILTLEISAREAMLQPSVERAAQDYLAMLQDDGAPRIALLEEFVETNDLVENNVTAALNASYAFYTGLNAAGAFGEFRSEEEMLREVWSQEETIRLDSGIWVMSYLAMAYQPLSDAEIERYIAFCTSTPGQQINSALFSGFDVVFRVVSREMGLAAAQFMGGSDL